MFRVIYELDGRHTFWSEHVERGKHGEVIAENVKTGETKIIGNATPHAITEVDSYPPRVEEAIADA